MDDTIANDVSNDDITQELPEEGSATQRDKNPPKELRCILKASQLAVVAALHQSEAPSPGRVHHRHHNTFQVQLYSRIFGAK